MDIKNRKYINTKSCYFIIDKKRNSINLEKLCELIVKLLEIKQIESFIFHNYGKIEKTIIEKLRITQYIMKEHKFKIYLNTFNNKNIDKMKEIFDDVILLDNLNQPEIICENALQHIGAFLGEICIFIVEDAENNIHIEEAKDNMCQYFIL